MKSVFNDFQEMPGIHCLASPCSTILLLFCMDTFHTNRVSLAAGMGTEDADKLRKLHPLTLEPAKQLLARSWKSQNYQME